MYENYPNPFNPSTVIKFDLKKSGFYSLEVFDIVGKKVKNLINENFNAGSYSINFNSENLPSGVYFYKLSGYDLSIIKKMIIVK